MTSELRDDIDNLDDDMQRILYTEFSAGARHFNNFIWLAIVFGVTPSLASFTLFKELDSVSYTFVGVATVIFLVIVHNIIEGIRSQWMDKIRVLNDIEILWEIRDPENDNGPLSPRPNGKPRPGATKRARIWLFRFIGASSVVSIGIKWVSVVIKWLIDCDLIRI